MVGVRLEGELLGFFRRAGGDGGLTPTAESSSEDGDGIPIPEYIDWNIHRIASSQRYSSSLIEIENEWTIDEVWDANEVLDILKLAEEKASEKAAREAKRKRR